MGHWQTYEIAFPGFFRDNPHYTKSIESESAGKAKYEVYLEFSDAYEMTFLEFLEIIDCRKLKTETPRVPILVINEYRRRIEIVNRIILEIGNKGDRMLYSNSSDRHANFAWDRNRLWYVDNFSGVAMEMKPHRTDKDRTAKHYFSNGGTMWGLVHDFKDFIYGDDDSNHNNGYGGLYCPHWGYPVEDMEAILAFAIEVGYLKSREVVAV